MRIAILLAAALPSIAYAQGPPPPPPPPPPLQPLGAPVAPPANPITQNKSDLGRALFWDEQLSSNGTMSCGSCHFPSRGGSDPRTSIGGVGSTHPGADGVFGTPDDVAGSAGVTASVANGSYLLDPSFGLDPQVTSRKSPSNLAAAYAPILFWDGRATGEFRDPITGQVLIPAGAALESQVLAPPVSSVEMGHTGIDWNDVAQRIASSTPLRLSPQVPASLSTWIAGRSYPELFGEVFGTTDVTPARIAMAIATYQRTAVANQTPLDAFLATGQGLTPLEQQGFNLFGQLNCRLCHAGNRFTDDQFHYIGVRPVNEDLGRFDVTGLPGDRGAFKTPSLRNVRDRGPYFHDGRFATLEEVVDFYDRGGDFNAPNKAPAIQPLGLTQQQKNALVAFLRRPLADPRAANETGPFERPLLYTESNRVPIVYGKATLGTGWIAPQMVALEPPSVGNTSMTIGLARGLGGAPAYLGIDVVPSLAGTTVLGVESHLALSPALWLIPVGLLQGTGPGGGFTSQSFSLQLPALVGATFYAQWFVFDTGASGGLFSASPAAALTLF
ncbi:MAG: cytochrome c peroxidase [Planctomycetota bacterium]